MNAIGKRGEVRTRRWNDPPQAGDGTRILVCRYRPRGLRKADETWDECRREVAPSRELHAAFYGKHAPPIGWAAYERRYLAEVEAQRHSIDELARRVAGGETITLLCSSACTDPSHCHRTLLAELIAEALG